MKTNKPPALPKRMVDTLFYDVKISKLTDRQLIEECDREIDAKYNKQGVLIDELMERLEQRIE